MEDCGGFLVDHANRERGVMACAMSCVVRSPDRK